MIKKSSMKNKIIAHRQSINISQDHRFYIVIISIAVIIFTLVINAWWMQPLYKQGVNMIHSAQQNLNWKILHIINNLFSMLCHPSTVGVLLIIQLCVVKHKLKALIHISFFLLCIFIIAVLKLAYQQSRPIWSSNRIHKWEWFCPKDFGNPSGHSFALFPLYEPIIAKYIGFQHFKSGWILLIVFGFLVPFSRTYLGVHSVNQVFFGLTLGITATVLYRYKVRQALYEVFAKIYKLKKIRYLVICLLIHAFCFLFPLVIYLIYSQNRQMEQNDVKNLNQFCLTSLTSLLIQQSMLIKCTFQSFILGIMYGLFFLSITKKDKLYFAGRWEYVSYQAIWFHALSITLLCGFIMGFFNVLLPKLMGNIFLNYLSHTIGMILMGFSIVYFLPKIQRHFQWIKYHQNELLLPQAQYQMEQKEKNNVGEFFG